MRIASLNALSDPDFILERVTQMFVEADAEGVDVLGLQEVPLAIHSEIGEIARAHEYPWQHVVSGVPGDEVGTFSRVPIEASGTLTVTRPAARPVDIAIGEPHPERKFSWVTVRGFLIFNVHLTWGAHNEPARLCEVAAIEAYARDAIVAAGTGAESASASRELVPVLLGDLNAEPDNDCVRFLRGKTPIDGVGTYWTDATLGTELQHVPTTRETNQWGRQSAQSRGVDASLLYPRRIDFMFSRGWRHGGRGTFRNAKLFGSSVTPDGIELSDHYGWVADLEE